MQECAPRLLRRRGTAPGELPEYYYRGARKESPFLRENRLPKNLGWPEFRLETVLHLFNTWTLATRKMGHLRRSQFSDEEESTRKDFLPSRQEFCFGRCSVAIDKARSQPHGDVIGDSRERVSNSPELRTIIAQEPMQRAGECPAAAMGPPLSIDEPSSEIGVKTCAESGEVGTAGRHYFRARTRPTMPSAPIPRITRGTMLDEAGVAGSRFATRGFLALSAAA